MGVLLYSYVSSEVLSYMLFELKTSNSSSKSDDSPELSTALSGDILAVMTVIHACSNPSLCQDKVLLSVEKYLTILT